MRVLYVEDDPLDSDLTRRTLARLTPQIQLEVVTTYAEATAKLANPAAYDLVLADMHLPDGSGLDLLTEIRKRKLPLAVVIITGLGEAELVVNVLKAGADDYVVKRADYLSRLPQLLADALTHSRAETARHSTQLRVLYAEQQASDAALTVRHMANHAPHIQLETVATASNLMHRLPSDGPHKNEQRTTAGAMTSGVFPYDIILVNCDLPGINVLELLKEVRQVRLVDVPIVLITEQGNEESALQALKLGAADYVVKNPGYLMRLPTVLENADFRKRLASEQVALHKSADWATQQLALLRAVYGASRQLAENLAGVAENVVSACVQMLGATVAWLGRAQPDGHIIMTARYPLPASGARPFAARWDDSLQEKDAVSRAIAAHKPVVLTSLAEDTGLLSEMLPAADTACCSCAAFPLINRDLVIGVLLLSSDQPGFFDHGRIEFFQMYADHAAAALENSRLYAEAQSYAAVLEQRVAERTAELSQNRDELNAANEALAKAVHLKDEFLASMSHELRTPLAGIMGMAELLNMGVYGTPTDKQQRALHNIEDSGRHLLALINDMLEIAKIEAGKLELKFDNVLLTDICQASLAMVKDIAAAKHQMVAYEVTPDNLRLTADARRLKQILVNLLSNAVKFTPATGRLGLRVSGDADRQVVRFEVWDEGIGIAGEDLDQLFRPFVQLDTRLTREQTGTGLGLSLVLRLTELHGGSVAVESTVGAGSHFIVTLPWRLLTGEGATLERTLITLPPVAATGPTKGAVLLAEDNLVAFALVRDFLTAQGYVVVPARNGQEAVHQLLEHRPDLVLMDVQMPVSDGLTATRNIRGLADRTLAAIPIIALTALAMPGDRERCIAAGVNAYLSKPVDFAAMLELIEHFVSHDA